MHVGAGVLHCVAQGGQACAGRLIAPAVGMRDDRCGRQCRAVCPDSAQQVPGRVQRELVAAEHVLQASGGLQCQYVAIGPDRAAGRQVFGQPLHGGGGITGCPLFKLDTAAFQLLGGLNPVPAIDPKAGVVLCDGQ